MRLWDAHPNLASKEASLDKVDVVLLIVLIEYNCAFDRLVDCKCLTYLLLAPLWQHIKVRVGNSLQESQLPILNSFLLSVDHLVYIVFIYADHKSVRQADCIVHPFPVSFFWKNTHFTENATVDNGTHYDFHGLKTIVQVSDHWVIIINHWSHGRRFRSQENIINCRHSLEIFLRTFIITFFVRDGTLTRFHRFSAASWVGTRILHWLCFVAATEHRVIQLASRPVPFVDTRLVASQSEEGVQKVCIVRCWNIKLIYSVLKIGKFTFWDNNIIQRLFVTKFDELWVFLQIKKLIKEFKSAILSLCLLHTLLQHLLFFVSVFVYHISFSR